MIYTYLPTSPSQGWSYLDYLDEDVDLSMLFQPCTWPGAGAWSLDSQDKLGYATLRNNTHIISGLKEHGTEGGTWAYFLITLLVHNMSCYIVLNPGEVEGAVTYFRALLVTAKPKTKQKQENGWDNTRDWIVRSNVQGSSILHDTKMY